MKCTGYNMELRNMMINQLNDIGFTKNISSNMEISIYNNTISYCKRKCIQCCWDNIMFQHIYVLHMKNVIYRLQHSPVMFDSISNGSVDPRKIATIHFEDFFPSMSTTTDEYVENQDGIFKCRRCNSLKTTYYSLQTRSSDEPMTCFVTCTECKNRWKC